MFGCVDAEQGQATGQHRPGGFGEREPGTVGGRGFLRAARKDGDQERQNGIGDGDEMPGEQVGGTVRGRPGEDAGVIGEGAFQRPGALWPLRIPRVVQLSTYDRMPRSTVNGPRPWLISGTITSPR